MQEVWGYSRNYEILYIPEQGRFIARQVYLFFFLFFLYALHSGVNCIPEHTGSVRLSIMMHIHTFTNVNPPRADPAT